MFSAIEDGADHAVFLYFALAHNLICYRSLFDCELVNKNSFPITNESHACEQICPAGLKLISLLVLSHYLLSSLGVSS